MIWPFGQITVDVFAPRGAGGGGVASPGTFVFGCVGFAGDLAMLHALPLVFSRRDHTLRLLSQEILRTLAAEEAVV